MRAWAAEWAPVHLAGGGVVALDGPLGAGKTTLVSCLVQALGSPDRVTSPTFALVHEYRGPRPIVHMDLYRLRHPEEFLELAESYLGPDVLAFVEWPERAGGFLPHPQYRLSLSILPRGRRLEVWP